MKELALDENFTKAYDLLTIGMRLAYMHSAGLIEIDTTTSGEVGLTAFALRISEDFPAYQEKDIFGNWDEYIEKAIMKEFGKQKED